MEQCAFPKQIVFKLLLTFRPIYGEWLFAVSGLAQNRCFAVSVHALLVTE
jgi:hypothetical protein